MSTSVQMKQFTTTPDGHNMHIFVLKSNKIEIGIINYGAAINYLKVPDKNGYIDDIVTGFDSLSGKLKMNYCCKLLPVY